MKDKQLNFNKKIKPRFCKACKKPLHPRRIGRLCQLCALEKKKTKQEKIKSVIKEKQLDILWSRKAKERAGGSSELSGELSDVLHVHHIFSRLHRNTRWDLDNAIVLTPREHLWFAHKDVCEFTLRLTELKGPDFIEKLRLKAHTSVQNDQSFRCQILKSLQ